MSLKHFGVIGTVIAVLCCSTPVLVVLLSTVGLSWLMSYLDLVLFPALFILIGIAIYALWREGYLQFERTNPNNKFFISF